MTDGLYNYFRPMSPFQILTNASKRVGSDRVNREGTRSTMTRSLAKGEQNCPLMTSYLAHAHMQVACEEHSRLLLQAELNHFKPLMAVPQQNVKTVKRLLRDLKEVGI